MRKTTYKLILALALSAGALSSCKKYLEIAPPTNGIPTASAFNNMGTIDAMINQLHVNLFNVATPLLRNAQGDCLADNGYNPTALTGRGLAGDMQVNNLNTTTIGPAGDNFDFINWVAAYQAIYMANFMLQGLPGANATGLSDATRAAYIAAAKTVRAYTYFQLVRGYGDVPLLTSTSLDTNKLGPRDSKENVYALIEKDLQEAIAGLPATRGPRTYINSRFIPEAILANVYLTEGKWAAAEAAAADIINSNQYQLPAVQDAFLQSSTESILATGYIYSSLGPNNSKVSMVSYYLLPIGRFVLVMESDYAVALSQDLLNSFEAGDLRRANWVVLSNNGGYPDPKYRMFCSKYKYTFQYDNVPAGREEDNKVIRLAEMYLIRAEARARQNNLTGAAADLNVIRTRAGLPNTTAATQTDMVEAVLKERRVELFFEEGHRWFDLVRTGRANSVLSAIPYKAANWKPYMVLFPIPQTELSYNPNLTQTPGY